jgi:hypothetical protein
MKKLGAAQYVDSALQNTVEELVKLGGAKGHPCNHRKWKSDECSVGRSKFTIFKRTCLSYLRRQILIVHP